MQPPVTIEISAMTHPEKPDGLRIEIERKETRLEKLKLENEHIIPKLNGGLLEIGCGHGHWITAYAARHPEQFCVGIDLIGKRVTKSISKSQKAELENVHLIKGKAEELIEILPNDLGIRDIVILFPDPWPKKRHHRRRLIQHDFLSEIALKTSSNANIYFRTDHLPYFEWTQEIILEHGKWDISDEPGWPMEHSTFFQNLMEEYFSLHAIRK